MRTLQATTRLTLAAMAAALGVLLLFGASVLPTLRVACLFVASLLIWIPLKEHKGGAYALLTYLCTALLSFFLHSAIEISLLYILFFGCYGLIKRAAESIFRDRFIAQVVKLLFFNLIIAGAVTAANMLFEIDIMSMLPKVADWIIVILVQAGLVAYDLIYELCTRFFDANLRRHIVRRR